jgi:hypothetical protein
MGTWIQAMLENLAVFDVIKAKINVFKQALFW